MALQTPSAGELRENLRFERLPPAVNVGGVVEAEWSGATMTIATTRAKVTPTRGGAEVIAGRMAGKTSYDIWIRSDSASRTLTNADRAVNNRTGEVYLLGQPIDPTGRRQWLLIQAVSGGNANEG
jgi:hypothetical protein